MEFEHVQSSLNFFSDSETTKSLITELCRAGEKLIRRPFVDSTLCEESIDADSLRKGAKLPTKEDDDHINQHSIGVATDYTRVTKDVYKNGNGDDNTLEALVQLTVELEALLSRYMHQPTLLYPYIELLVSGPFALLKDLISLSAEDQIKVITATSGSVHSRALIALEHLCYHIYNVSKAVGLRRIVAYAPNEVAFLVPVTSLVEWLQTPHVIGDNRYESRRWCLEYVSLAWLSLLVYTPFDLGTIWKDGSDNSNTLQNRIVRTATHYLNLPTKSRDAAAIVLSSLFSRPDVSSDDLARFMSHCTWVLTRAASKGEAQRNGVIPSNDKLNDDEDIFASAEKPSMENCPVDTESKLPSDITTEGASPEPYSFTISRRFSDHGQIGILTVLKQMLKRMSRDDLSAHIPHIGNCLLDRNWNPSSSACRKLKAACLGRLAVHLLPSEYFSQRYRRMCRKLIQSDVNEEEPKPTEYEVDIDERIEVILEHLLTSLVDNDIRVRWASAKSIGRISLKLPIELNEEIVEHVLKIIYKQYDPRLMCFVKGEAPVHGGCLALAEIIRNGLLYPRMLNSVLDCVILTLGFDVWRGKGSEGTAVRDASCYICWAVVRNFSSTLLQPASLIPMSKALVNMALFDISINCRRAAGAAIQELVGRVGSIPHGLSIIVLADYYSVANRRNAFVDVSFEVSKLGFYTLSMIDNLMRTKIHHPDITTRRLAAVALGKISLSLVDAPNSQLVTRNGRPVYLELLDSFISNATSTNLGVMHGSLCALVELLSGLLKHGELVLEHFQSIKDIPVTFERKRLFRLKGGTLIREAVANLIQYICRICNMNGCLSVSNEELDIYVAIIKDCMRNFSNDVQVSAAAALEDLFSSMIALSTEKASSLASFIMRSLQNIKDHVGARRGYALALGSVPVHYVPTLLEPVLSMLCDTLLTNYEHPEIKDAQTRQNAVLSIIRIIEKGKCLTISDTMTEMLISCLEFGCNDFEVDSRGDVGSWVREVTVEGIAYIWYALYADKEGRAAKGILGKVNGTHALRLMKCLIGVCLESMELTRARATLFLAHMFEPSFYFNATWIWRRLFHGYIYEYEVVKASPKKEQQIDIPSVMHSAAVAVIDATTDNPERQLDCNMSIVGEEKDAYYMSVDSTPMGRHTHEEVNVGAPFDTTLETKGATPMKITSITPLGEIISSIAHNVNWSITNSYDIHEILEKVQTDGAGSIDSLNKSHCNTSLRLPGYGVAPLCFEHLMWLLLLPECSTTVVSSLIHILGGISLHQVWKGRTVEQVVANFLNEHKRDVIQLGDRRMTLQELVLSHLIELYRPGTGKRNYKLCTRVVTAMRILVSHGTIGYSREFIDILSSETVIATNYNYLKSIVKCLQAHCASVSDKEPAKRCLGILIHFLEHQYPTLRFFAQASLIIALNSCDEIYSRETLDAALETTVSSALEEQTDCKSAMSKLIDILEL